MANVLLAWELGAGLGHLVNLLPLVRGLTSRGHRVYIALRDLSRAESVFGKYGVGLLQAPMRVRSSVRMIAPNRTFAHLLHNNGFGSQMELRALSAAWRTIFDFVRPDLIVFDHSPTALLAARPLETKRALIGTGFFCPRDEYPMPDLRPSLPAPKRPLHVDEDAVLGAVNQLLREWNSPPLDRLSNLYRDVDEHFLVSFAELDHYGQRESQRYWGAWPNVSGKPPVWPRGDGSRIYAYLKPFSALGNLLAALRELRLPTLIYVDGITRAVQEKYVCSTLRFENERLDLAEVGRQCDLAILNGNHGTTVSMLLAGKPTLQIPLFLEQGLFSRAVERLGAGLTATTSRPEQITIRLIAMLSTNKFRDGAKRFAAQYAEFDPEKAVSDLVDRADQLASAAS